MTTPAHSPRIELDARMNWTEKGACGRLHAVDGAQVSAHEECDFPFRRRLAIGGI